MRPDRTNRDELLALLAEAGALIKGSAFHCPWHDDASASGSIFCAANHHWRWRCHACNLHGDAWDVAARVSGRSLSEWLQVASAGAGRQIHPLAAGATSDRRPRRHWPTLDALMQSKAAQIQATIEACYSYLVPGTSEPVLVVIRLRTGDGRKTFRQAHRDADGWLDATPAKPWPLYRLPDLAGHDQIFLVEGEKSAEALWDLGIPATTTPGGAGKAAHCQLSPLQNVTVILWPDHDPPGLAHMDDVAHRLCALPVPARILRIDPVELGLNRKEDVVDYLQRIPGDVAHRRLAIWALLSQRH